MAAEYGHFDVMVEGPAIVSPCFQDQVRASQFPAPVLLSFRVAEPGDNQ